MRWLVDHPADGPTNMAIDEALLERVGRGESPPTLRFYRWDPPTVSLGYFQPFAHFAALPPPAGRLPVVRRVTGGGAILHDLELTYALVLPLDHPLVADGRLNHLYYHVHGAVAELLAAHGVAATHGPAGASVRAHAGPFFCFERHCCFDLLVDGRKIMGSAQRRTRNAVLQHGSLILDRRFDQQKCAAIAHYTDLDMDACLPRLASQICGIPVGDAAGLDPAERALAHSLRARYVSEEWTRRR